MRVVAPVLGGACGQGGSVKGLFFAEVLGVEDDLAVGARRDGGQGGEVDGHGHDKALGVIGVFADQVDAAGRDKDRGLRLKRARCMERRTAGSCISSHILSGFNLNNNGRGAGIAHGKRARSVTGSRKAVDRRARKFKGEADLIRLLRLHPAAMADRQP